jgi:hypothetical protein
MTAGADRWTFAEVSGLGRAVVVKLLEQPPGVR